MKPSVTSRIAAMAAPTPILALAPVESPKWEGSSDKAAGIDAFVGADEIVTELVIVWEVEVIVDVGPYTVVT